jgi:hypothetical protein
MPVAPSKPVLNDKPRPPTCTASCCCCLQLKDLLMATYFAADHVVWTFQIGLISDKKTGERAQKASLWSWALGSVLTMIIEANAILSVSPAACAFLAAWFAAY